MLRKIRLGRCRGMAFEQSRAKGATPDACSVRGMFILRGVTGRLCRRRPGTSRRLLIQKKNRPVWSAINDSFVSLRLQLCKKCVLNVKLPAVVFDENILHAGAIEDVKPFRR